MLINPTDLRSQYDRAAKEWPFFADIAKAHGLPPFLLHAVGSRETNLTNERGDGGHGHGVFQLDDRWHQIPADFDGNVPEQARWAASMLKANLDHYRGQIHPAVAAYNCGIGNADAGIRLHGDPDYWTTHSAGIGYGAEVLARWQWLRSTYGPPKPVLPAWYHRVLRMDKPMMHGDDVLVVQRKVGLTGKALDGWYGNLTARKVQQKQVALDLRADGQVGPVTAIALG